MKILAADDQPIILKSIQRKLEEAGFVVDAAENGQEAIDYYDKSRPDLVIVDLNMPIKSGFDVIKHIKASDAPSTPIIVMSGFGDENTILKAFYEGIDDYIEKPVSISEVVVRVKRLLKLPLSIAEMNPGYRSKSEVLPKNGIGIVIPCYNEEALLTTPEFLDFVKNNKGYVLCFVNDGSTDHTLSVLKHLQKCHEASVIVYNCERRGGKGNAIRLGINYLLKDASLEYIGFMNANLTTSFCNLAKTITTSDYKLVIAARKHLFGSNKPFYQADTPLGKTFHMLVRQLFGMDVNDMRGEAKIMSREVAMYVASEPFLTRSLFNLEIILRMKRLYGEEAPIKQLDLEQPVKQWVEKVERKFTMKESFNLMNQLYQVSRQYHH